MYVHQSDLVIQVPTNVVIGIVIEPQDWIDGINNPQFGRVEYQVYSPSTEPAVNYALYDFSVVT
jgi:hypothetical protein